MVACRDAAQYAAGDILLIAFQYSRNAKLIFGEQDHRLTADELSPKMTVPI
jgi:hypothetical protein